ncbi:hypothetical protein M758_12G138300 [Ceratodon purpureus]|uniref:Uncharacterized protein n=1 Tax=Ceratodon purpureus TaxID=3225 RepID=A0A8T0GCK1_CERPU|nr:hypothetical protein KC19_12G135000 [Ceratodon purpureus]KAG0599246.1 hypothetical protein M758_12G138300 [Ceratodon purpureus]
MERHVGHIATGDDDVTDAWGTAQVVKHLALPVDRLELEAQLIDRRRGVADQVHPGAVTAVLRAGGQQLREYLGGVAVGEALDGPHLVLVQRVASGVGVAGCGADQPVGGDWEHVAANRIGQHGRGRRHLVRHHRVEHLRRQQQRHRRPARLIGLDVDVERLVQQIAVNPPQLPQVLHTVAPLPLRATPLVDSHIREAGQPTPVRLHQFVGGVLVGLLQHVAVTPRSSPPQSTTSLARYGRNFGEQRRSTR